MRNLFFPITRLLRQKKVASDPPTSEAASNFADFLFSLKAKYLGQVNVPTSQWTVVLGNEAGDLDSLASSLAYAWFLHEVKKSPAIAVIRTEKQDLSLRKENIFALQLAGVLDPCEQLLCITDVANLHPFPARRFALVDHNSLSSTFSSGSQSVKVVAVVDHHEDEGQHMNAKPRIIAPAGSCSSHVANILQGCNLPPELAKLLLCAILIDTNGLKPGGKALDIDRTAVSFLFTQCDSPVIPRGMVPPSSEPDTNDAQMKFITAQLSQKKNDVSNFSPYDLLRRDYKEYEIPLKWHPSSPVLKAGLSTVPLPLKTWAGKNAICEPATRWMTERNLALLGVLTSFKTKNGRKKHRRETLWLLHKGADFWKTSADDTLIGVHAIMKRLCKGLEANTEIRVKRYKKFDLGENGDLLFKAYKQGNPRATRKVIAPLLKSCLQDA